MQIDTSKITGGIGSATGGFLGMILGQESGGYSRKYLVLGGAVLVAILAWWKLPALTHSKAWDDILGLAKWYLIAQGFADGMAAFKKPSAPKE